MNIRRLSNNDGEGNENVLGYQNECTGFFFFNLFALIYFISLQMANVGELPYEVLGTAPKFGLREEIEFAPVFVLKTTLQKEI